jgi:hypothetical protein
MSKTMKTPSQGLRCVVQVGFAGSRQLVKPAPEPAAAAEIDAVIRAHLITQLCNLPKELKLGTGHFLCGISQVAVGADTLFCEACRELDIPQRIFLSQHGDDYLAAVNSEGVPDFDPREREKARQLLDSPHVIQERVVSDAAGRRERFEDVSLEILRVSDVVVCLLRDDANGVKKGGTLELLERAQARERPALEIRVTMKDGQPVLASEWHNLDKFEPPALPAELASIPASDPADRAWPDVEEYGNALKDFASAQARGRQRWFRYSAVFIILTHVLATVCASVALAAHGLRPSHEVHEVILGLLGLEIGTLLLGFLAHYNLHRSKTAALWAMSRLAAEVYRSVRAAGKSHVYLHYLFQLPMPERILPVLRTLNVLKLRSTRPFRNEPWQPLRDAYVSARLDGQIKYYTDRLAEDQPWLHVATRAFGVLSVLAIGATVFKLLIVAGVAGNALAAEHELTASLGVLAIILPVLAVGTMSLAAAMDLEARTHTFGDVLKLLQRQRKLLTQAATRREFEGLMLRAEAALLGETANWYSRRSYLGV